MAGLRTSVGTGTSAMEADIDPARDVESISGVRIHDVGQGDSISVLDERGDSFMQIDYGGFAGHPYAPPSLVDDLMPVHKAKLLMLSHWDQDHWCSAPRGSDVKNVRWLVPRQTASPRAVAFSLEVKAIECVPEHHVGETMIFRARNGDAIWWQKLAPWPGPWATAEDCNASGIAYAVVKNGGLSASQVILLPGDAPYDRVSFYDQLRRQGCTLRGLMAFHHGSRRHWRRKTFDFLGGWAAHSSPLPVVFSCSANNPYGHPYPDNYGNLPHVDVIKTDDLRTSGRTAITIKFL